MDWINFRFDLEQNVGTQILYGETVWDLHNFGSFLGFYYNVADHTVTLQWSVDALKPPSHGAEPSPQLRIDTVFTGVTYFEVTPRDPEMPGNEDETLSTIGWIFPDDDTSEFVKNEWVSTYSPFKAHDADSHLLFRFWGGHVIRIAAGAATLALVEP